MVILLLKFVLIAVLIAINGFFVAVEFAIVSVQQVRIHRMALEGNSSARTLERWKENPDRLIAGAQLGITIASLALGALGEQTIAQILDPWLRNLPPLFTTTVATSLPLLISLVFVTGLHVVLGEQVPKSITIRYPVRVALLVVRPMSWFLNVFHPFISLLDSLAAIVLRLIRTEPIPGHHTVFSVDELKQIVIQSQQDGILEEQERQMLHAVFDFRALLARHVMMPRTEMICVEDDAPIDKVLDLAIEHPYTKFPVYHEDLDHIVGIVHTKDLLRVVRNGQTELRAKDLMRPALSVPETVRVDDLLADFRKHRVHAAVLIDEFGGTSGFVTLEDLLEEIVGDVQGEFDRTEPEIRYLADGTTILSGLMTIDECNELFGLHISDPNYDTIAGFMLGKLGRMAQLGDTVETNGIRLQVHAMDGRRIDRIRLEFVGKTATDKQSIHAPAHHQG